jgi:DNA invertase Pin-like site-specific DNA recombinase
MKRQTKHPVDDAAEAPVRRLYGYARVSTDDQNLTMQIEALTRAGVERAQIYEDKRSGKNLKRGGLQDVLSLMREGDVLVVWRFDRLSRSVRDLLFLFDDLHSRGIALRSIHEHLDTTTAMGKLMFQLAGVLAEFERNLIADRTRLGMATARAHGRKFGPDRKLTDKQLDAAIKWLRPRKHERGAVQLMARKLGVSAYTLRDRIFERLGERLWPRGPRARD